MYMPDHSPPGGQEIPTVSDGAVCVTRHELFAPPGAWPHEVTSNVPAFATLGRTSVHPMITARSQRTMSRCINVPRECTPAVTPGCCRFGTKRRPDEERGIWRSLRG